MRRLIKNNINNPINSDIRKLSLVLISISVLLLVTCVILCDQLYGPIAIIKLDN